MNTWAGALVKGPLGARSSCRGTVPGSATRKCSTWVPPVAPLWKTDGPTAENPGPPLASCQVSPDVLSYGRVTVTVPGTVSGNVFLLSAWVSAKADVDLPEVVLLVVVEVLDPPPQAANVNATPTSVPAAKRRPPPVKRWLGVNPLPTA